MPRAISRRSEIRCLHHLQPIDGERVVERAPVPQGHGAVDERGHLHGHDDPDVAGQGSRRGLAGLAMISVRVGPRRQVDEHGTSATVRGVRPGTSPASNTSRDKARREPASVRGAAAQVQAERRETKSHSRWRPCSAALQASVPAERRGAVSPGIGALLGEPRAQIDQPAALAAERPERRRRPVDLAPAGRTFDATDRQALRCASGAAAQHERHVGLGLRRACRQAIPGEEAHAAAVVAAADLRIQPGGGRQRDAQQLQRIVALEGDVEGAAARRLPCGCGRSGASATAAPRSHRTAAAAVPSHWLKVRMRASSGCASQK